MITEKQYQQIDEMYNYEYPEYLKILSKSRIQIRACKWEGDISKWITITVKDVVNYYNQGNPMGCGGMSGCRALSNFTSDWRMIDNMAKECLEIFKIINRKSLEKEGEKLGMTLI